MEVVNKHMLYYVYKDSIQSTIAFLEMIQFFNIVCVCVYSHANDLLDCVRISTNKCSSLCLGVLVHFCVSVTC